MKEGEVHVLADHSLNILILHHARLHAMTEGYEHPSAPKF